MTQVEDHRLPQRGVVAGRRALALLLLAAALTGCDGGPVPTVAVSSPPPDTETADSETPAAAPGDTVALEAGEPTSERVAPKTFDDIKFDIEPDAPFYRSMLTDEIESLVGQRIRIRGFMLPTARTKGLKHFVLVRDNEECCYGPGAALYDCILIEMVPGKTAEFSMQPVAVEGRFSIEEFTVGRRTLAIYRLAAETVEL